MKRYPIPTTSPELEPHHQMLLMPHSGQPLFVGRFLLPAGDRVYSKPLRQSEKKRGKIVAWINHWHDDLIVPQWFGARVSILGLVIPKTQKMVLDNPYLTLIIIRYVSRISGAIQWKEKYLSPTPRYSSYWKGNLRVAFDYGRPTYIYVVYSIGFQTFFVQAFKIVVDSWKFCILLLYILWDDWPISNEQLQEYTLPQPDCQSWWI